MFWEQLKNGYSPPFAIFASFLPVITGKKSPNLLVTSFLLNSSLKIDKAICSK